MKGQVRAWGAEYADTLQMVKEQRDKYRRAIELIAEDCESWIDVESDVGGYSFVKGVARYAREVLQ